MNDEGEINMAEEPSSEYVCTYSDYLTGQFEENMVVFILNTDGKFDGCKMYAGKTISPHFMPELKLSVRDIFKN
jgi:hypothetical protein